MSSSRSWSQGWLWTALVLVALVALIGLSGSEGRTLLAVVVLLGILLRLNGQARHREGPQLNLHPLGSVAGAVGLAGLALGRADIAVTTVVLLLVSGAVSWWSLRGLAVGASTERRSAVGELAPVHLRLAGVREPVSVRLLHPTSDRYGVPADATGTIPHRALHRAVFFKVGVQSISAGWLMTVLGSRTDLVDLDAPIAVHPRPEPVPLPQIVDTTGDRMHGPTRAPATGLDGPVQTLRPYRPGDPPRHVHWPTTARTGELAVRELEDAAGPAIIVSVCLPYAPSCRSCLPAYLDHLDAVTGQAMHTVSTLLARGAHVTVATVEHRDLDDERDPVTVVAPVRDRVELGHRLAAAVPGVPDVAAAPAHWRLGPGQGSARRTDEEPRPPERPLFAAHPDGAAAEHHPTEPSSAPASPWPVTLTGLAALLVLNEADVSAGLRASVVLAALGGAAAYVWRGRLGKAHAVAAGLFAAGTGLGITVASRSSSVLLAAVAWVMPRLLALDLASVAAAERSLRTSQPWGIGAAAAAVVTVGVGAITNWFLGPVAGLAVLAGGRLLARNPDWNVIWWSGAVAAWLVSAVVVPAWPLAAMTVVAVVALFVLTTATEDADLPPLDGITRRPTSASHVLRIVFVCAVIATLVPFARPMEGLGEPLRDRIGDLASAGSSSGTASSGPGNRGGEPWLMANPEFDVTRRPELSNRVLLEIEADRPSLWRGQTFDVFDGRRWTATPTEPLFVPDGDLPGEAIPGREILRQRVTVKAGVATNLLAAADPLTVEMDQSTFLHHDATLSVAGTPLLTGDSYTVTSQLPQATAETLRASAATAVPDAMREQYATLPLLTPRSRQLIEDVAGDEPTPYDQVLALTAWLGDNVRYSLEAPLPRPSDDVVDHFLFEAREGWCEHIATTLTLAMRHLGVPARLVTGFAPGQWNGRHFVVRERDAHAWVEVYFPGVGWQGFDPTVSVPLSGEAATPPPLARDLPVWLVGVLGLLAVVGAAAGLVRGRSPARTHPGVRATVAPRAWSVGAAQRLKTIAERWDVDRRPGESVVELGHRLARTVGDDRIALVAQVIEYDAYARTPASQEARRQADEVLDDVARTPTGAT